ncbi:assembly factor cbp4 [Coniochaeta pulveracea]|uniref:Cytochrome b mRNA-processing protein 4 n=1 Tax=Coniochaeta pulveracea TaxID=177199 RepID=A0A420Y5U0_9PEZI|nr:assembly factor cbp4 [Coniochaeta pulveracea]
MAAKKPTNWWLWTKMLIGGGALMVGGPAFVLWVSPTDEELFQKYSPELKKKSLERRFERETEFDDFVGKLKEYSKSDKPIWVVQEEAERKARQERIQEGLRIAEDVKRQKEEIRRAAGLPVNSER